jgi:hypothetical protein
MRNRIIAVLAAALAALPAAAGAQARQDAALQQAAAPALPADPRVAASVDVGEAAPAAAVQAPAALAQTRESRAVSTRRRVALTLGGAIVGGWAGYLGSQVARSDWDKQNNSDFSSYRMGFTVGGALLGGLTGLLVSGSGGGEGMRPARSMTAGRDGGSSRDVINEDEIRQSTARNALELVQALRPEWLQRRGTQNQRESGRADQTGERSLRIIDPEGGIKVYLDNALIGEVTQLREIPLTSVYQARFMDAASATYRFGSGHTHGAIVLTSNLRAQ